MTHRRLGLLAAVFYTAACGGSDTTEPGDLTIRVELTRSGNATSSQSVSVRWTAPTGPVGTGSTTIGGSTVLNVPEAGSFTIELLELPDHCFTERDQTTAPVSDGVAGTASFDITCVGGFAHQYNTRQLAYRDLSGEVTEHEYVSRLFLFDWDPTGRYLPFRENDVPGCPLHVFDEQTGAVTAVSGSAGGYAGREPIWAPDAERFVVLRTGGCAGNEAGDALLLIDPTTGARLDSIVGLIDASGFAWGSTSARTTYTAGNDIRWRDWDAGTDSLFVSLAEAPRAVSWAPDNAVLATSGADFLALFDAAGNEINIVSDPGATFEGLHWSPDGSLLATEDGLSVSVFDATGQEVFSLTPTGGGFITTPRWAPDSGSLLFTGNDGARNYIGWIDATGNGRRALTDDVGDEDEPRWAGGSDVFLYHTVVDGGLALYLGTLNGPLRTTISGLPRSGIPRWRPNVSLDLN